MANRFSSINTDVVTTNTACAATTLVVLSPVIDTRQGICGSLHGTFNLTTASASQKVDVYAVYSYDGTNFDETADKGFLKALGSVALTNDTNAHKFTIPLDGLAVACPYMKIAVYASAAGTLQSLKCNVRVAN